MALAVAISAHTVQNSILKASLWSLRKKTFALGIPFSRKALALGELTATFAASTPEPSIAKLL